jgi:hypothetical protein
MHLDVQSANNSDANAAEMVKMLFIAELVEIFMSYNNQRGATTWKAGDSNGEGLSQLCNIERFRTGHYLYYGSFVDTWLQSATRTDWVSNPESTDKDKDSYGCALLFLYYLRTQLNYTPAQIIQAGASTLEGTYHNLTGNSGAFAAFNGLVGSFFPVGNTPKLQTFDDPFPLYGISRRDLSIGIAAADTEPPSLVTSGSAKVTPFFMCPVKDYAFSIESSPQTVKCTATETGFGQPNFSWRINGIDAPSNGSINVAATVIVDDTFDPQKQSSAVQSVPIDTSITTTTWTSTLTLYVPATVIGHVDLTVEARATETYASPGDVTDTTTWTTADNERVVWEDAYYQDGNNCRAAFSALVRSLERFEHVNILLTLPDPPPDYERYMRQFEAINGAIQLVEQGDPRALNEIRGAVMAALGLTPQLLSQLASQRQHIGQRAQPHEQE